MARLTLVSFIGRRLGPLIVLAALAGACAPTTVPLAVPPSGAATLGDASPGTQAPGTVKVHDGNTEPGTTDDPKVCAFHLHFFFGAGSSGTWRIDTQPGGSQVLIGTWSSGGAPDVRVPPAPDLLSLPDGQYKLSWTQDGQNGDKQKVFKVDCSTASASPQETAAPVPSSTAAPAETASPTAEPTAEPTVAPSATPAATPAPTPSPGSTQTPTSLPTAQPTATPPAVTPVPTAQPTPTATPPAETPGPTAHPTQTPPAVTPVPTAHPTQTPPAVTPVPTAPEATATPDSSGGVGGETGGTKTPRPGGGGGAGPATDAAPATAATRAPGDGGTHALLILAIGVLMTVLLVLRRGGARR